MFEETASEASKARPQLQHPLDFLRPDDTLVVWKLDTSDGDCRMSTYEVLAQPVKRWIKQTPVIWNAVSKARGLARLAARPPAGRRTA